MQPYRLEMGTKLSFDNNKNLYDYWRKRLQINLTPSLENEPVLILLATNILRRRSKVSNQMFIQLILNNLRMATIKQ